MKKLIVFILMLLAVAGLCSCHEPVELPTSLWQTTLEPTTTIQEPTTRLLEWYWDENDETWHRNEEWQTYVRNVPLYQDADHVKWRKNKDEVIEKVKEELTQKGWSDLEVGSYEEDRYMSSCEVVGHVDNRYNNPMTIHVWIDFSGIAPEKAVSAWYVSKSGSVHYPERRGILPADDQGLYEYFKE